MITVQTAHTTWLMRPRQDGSLAQLFYGATSEVPASFPTKEDALPPVLPAAGDGYIWEPALRAVHADGNTSTDLQFVSTATERTDDNVSVTRVQLRDPAYPFFVTLCFRTYREQDVVEQWVEIHHDEPGAVTLYNFASTALVLPSAKGTFLTTFQGDWADEAQPVEEKLSQGIKIVDSKLGVRADQYVQPSFLLGLGAPAKEESGKVIAGSLEWTGSFQLAFENHQNHLRALCGMNPFDSQYHVARGETFATPAMVWAYSDAGKGPLSRQLHRWARRYVLRDGDRPRAVLLNNWEATGFNFDEVKLLSLFDGAKQAGMELFLLDDGWFGNRYPRNSDKAGLGDWQVNEKKLPNGLTFLADNARQRGLRFGLWFEPEMVNPQSDLFGAHPEWVIQQPHRPLQLMRNQAVLDLTRPEVRDFAFHVLDDALTKNPGISYVKWDCNRYITQPGSTYLKPENQSHLWIDYVRALYGIMAQVAERHPKVEMMLCSGGGGRVDFGALRYFHEFWPSDKTDPVRRIPMQWNYSYFFPSMAVAGHVTHMGNRPLKLALDVAMSVRLGFDVDLAKYKPEELRFLTAAVALYKTELRDVVQQGNLYRLEDPEEGPRVSLNYVSADLSRAVLFVYQTGKPPATPAAAHPRGLDPQRQYLVREVNLPEGTASSLPENGKTMAGATLMSEGLASPWHTPQDSAVIEITAVSN